MEKRELSRALYPGRFQPFHMGHIEAIKHILKKASEIIIMVGSALQSHTLQNPFTAGERICMISLGLREARLDPAMFYIIPVTDLKIHGIWVAHVCSLVPKFDVVYSNEPLTKRLFTEAGFDVRAIPLYKRRFCQATEIRNRMLQNRSWEEILPETIVHYIREIDGVERLKNLVKTDKV